MLELEIEIELKNKEQQQEKQEILNNLLNDYVFFHKENNEKGKEIILEAIEYLLS